MTRPAGQKNRIDLMVDKRIRQGLEKWVEEGGYRESGVMISDLAELLDVDVVQLSAFFAGNVRKGFKEWRKQLRIKEAQILLLEDRKASLNQIARRVGIEDHSDFRRQFRDVTGCFPGEWRRLNGPVKGRIRLLLGKIKVVFGNRIGF